MHTSTKLSVNQKGISPILIIILIAAILGGLAIYQKQNLQPKPNPSPQLTSQSTFASPTTKPSNSKISSVGNYIVSEEMLGDYNKIKITEKSGKVITEDLIALNEKKIGYNVKFKCQCGTSFKEWINNVQFTIKIVNGGGEKYEYTVDATTGQVDENSFKRISGKGETANWKTYVDTKYGYSLQYPPNVIVTENPGRAFVRETKTGQTEAVTIVTFNIEGGTLTVQPNPGGRGINPGKSKIVFIGRQKTEKRYESETSGIFFPFETPKGDRLEFDFTLPSNTVQTEETDRLIDQILSTFKFTQ